MLALLALAIFAPAGVAAETQQSPTEHAITEITAQGWWSDASGTATLEQAQRAPYIPFVGVLTRGYGSDTIWIRLHLSAARHAEHLVLRIQQPQIDEIALFDPVEIRDGLIVPRYSGDRRTIKDGDYVGPKLGFYLLSSETERDIYLRVRTTSTRAIYIELLSQTAADQADRSNQIVISLYLGMLLMLLVWMATRYFFSSERLLALFTLRLALAVGQGMVGSGLARLILHAMEIDVAVQHMIVNVVILLAVFCSLACDLMLLREFDPPQRLWNAAVGLLALLPVTTLLAAADRLWLCLQINNGVMIVMSFVFLALAWSGRAWDLKAPHQHGLPSRGVLRTLYALILITGLPIFLSSAGFGDLPAWLINSPLLYTLLSSMVFLLVIFTKERAKQSLLQETTLQARVAEQVSTTERERREEQERFLEMLAHEIKNPLAAIRTLSENPAVRPTDIDKIKGLVSDIDSVIKLCVQSGQLEQGKFERLDHDCDVGDLLGELQDRSTDRARIRLGRAAATAVRTDSRLLKIILENLLGNALKYSASGSVIDITARRTAREARDGVEVEIANPPGRAGFPDPAQVFEKFYRDPGARSVTGSGLGLYLVHNLAHLLGATVEYVPDPVLVRFKLWLPC